MEKDPEPAFDAITTSFSTMFGSVSARTSGSSQIASLGLCKARIEGRERRNAALARRGTVVSLSEQSARVAPEEGAAEAKGDT